MENKQVLRTEVVLFGCLLLSFFCGLKLGYMDVSWTDILSIFVGQEEDRAITDIVCSLRLPRVVLAALAGGGLSLSGVVMQAILANPLADPYILGVSAGASLGAVMAIFLDFGLWFGASVIGLGASLGALVVSMAVLAVASIGRQISSARLLLAGMAFHTLCASAASFFVFIGANKDGMQSISYWLLGNVANVQWNHVLILAGVVLITVLFFLTQAKYLDLMLMGSQSAMTLGVNIAYYRFGYLMVNAVLLGFIVYNAGILGFLGILVPHTVRLLVGAGHRVLIPMTVLSGGIFGVWADIIGRVLIAGIEIPFGVMLALTGGPFFLYLVAHKKYSFGGED